MPRAQVNSKFVSQSSISVDTASTVNWALSGSTGTPSIANVSIPLSPGVALGSVPSTGMQITQGTAASQTNIIRSFGASPLDLSAAAYIDILVYWPNAPVGNTPTLYIDSTGANFTNYFLATLNGSLTGSQKRGWNVYRILKSAFSTGAGSPTWANITRLQFRLTATAGADTLILCQINAAYRSRAKVLLTLDDGPISQFAAAQEANTAGLKVTLNIVPSLIISGGGTTYMTAANLQTLLAAGNAIQTHGWDHTSFTAQSDGGYADVLQQRSWMDANGLGAASNSGYYHHAFVQGDHNGTVDAAMAKAGVLSARCTRGSSYSAGPPEKYEQTASWDQQNGSFGLVDSYSLNCAALVNSSYTDVNALAAVDKAITHGVSVWFYAHVLSASASDFSTGSWTALVNGIKARQNAGLIDSITQPTYYRQIQDGRAFG